MWTRLMVFLGLKDHPREMSVLWMNDGITFDEWYAGWKKYRAQVEREHNFVDRLMGRKPKPMVFQEEHEEATAKKE